MNFKDFRRLKRYGYLFAALIPMIFSFGTAQAELVCRQCPFDCQGIGGRDRDCGDRPMRGGQCCVDLDDRGLDQLQRKDEENSRYPRRQDNSAYDDRNGYQPGDCPPGYHVNDRKCTNDERKRGCHDQHSPSGQTCVGWF